MKKFSNFSVGLCLGLLGMSATLAVSSAFASGTSGDDGISMGSNKELIEVHSGFSVGHSHFNPATDQNECSDCGYRQVKDTWDTNSVSKKASVSFVDQTHWAVLSNPGVMIEMNGNSPKQKYWIRFETKEKADAFNSLMHGNQFAQLRLYEECRVLDDICGMPGTIYESGEVGLKLSPSDKSFVSLNTWLAKMAPDPLEKMKTVVTSFFVKNNSAPVAAPAVTTGVAKPEESAPKYPLATPSNQPVVGSMSSI